MSTVSQVLYLPDGLADLTHGRVHRAQTVSLTATETALLRYLAERPEVAQSRPALLQAVWGYAPGVSSRTLDTTIKRLRRKLEVDPRAPSLIRTVRGTGYRWCGPAPWPRSLTAPAPAILVGRVRQRDALLALLAGSRPRIGIAGSAGIGKTALAATIVHQLALDTPVCWVEAHGLRSTDAVLAHLAVQLNLTTGTGEGSLKRALAARDGWLVLDGLDVLGPHTQRLVERLSASIRVLFTAREPLSGETTLYLRGLDPPDGVALMLTLAESSGYVLGAGDEEPLHRIVDAVAGNPQALRIVAPHLGLRSPARVLEQLEGHGGELADVVGQMVEALPDDTVDGLVRCTVFPTSFDPDAAAAVGVEADVLAGFERGGWLTRVPGPVGPRFRMPRAIRAAGAGGASAAARSVTRATALDRMAAHFLGWGPAHAARAVNGDLRARESLNVEVANLVGAFEHLCDTSIDAAATLALTLSVWAGSRDPSAAIDVCARAHALGPSTELGAELALAIGTHHSTLGEVTAATAWLAQALDAPQGPVRHWAGARLAAMRMAANAAEATALLDAAEAASEDPALLGFICGMRGAQALERSDAPAAIHHLEAAQVFHSRLGWAEMRCATRMRLGFAYLNAGRILEAQVLCDEAAREAQTLGALPLEIWASSVSTMCRIAAAHFTEAAAWCDAGRSRARSIGDRWHEAIYDALHATILHLDGRLDDAAMSYPHALRQLREVQGFSTPYVQAQYAVLLADLGRHDEAHQTARDLVLPTVPRALLSANLAIRAGRRPAEPLPPTGGDIRWRFLEMMLADRIPAP